MWDTLTVEETDGYLDWLDSYERAQEEASDKLKQGR